ncbi:MAG: hypothetical protein IJI65_10165 [Lachnospiraceae bacterium]|nr:hypothetical protein [Lachnospiraceae bacterium]
MRSLESLWHTLFVAAVLLLLVGLPFATHFDLSGFSSSPDAVSSATIELPDQPSGEFLVIINKKLHNDTLSDWEKFFLGEELPVIFDDIRCASAKGDAGGIQLAERFRAQLPENQMTFRTEDPTLFISKVEEGYIDIAVISKEMADVLGFNPERLKRDMTVVSLSGKG